MYVEHEALDKAKVKMDKTISVFKRELSHIRAGRANPQLLDGVMVEPGEENYYPLAVVIDNHFEARPPSGLARANFVIEAPVEGGISRYLAFYSASEQIDEIGPIRSARPYFVDWAREFSGHYRFRLQG